MCFGSKPRPHPPSYSPTTNGPSNPYGPRARGPNPYTARPQGAAKILGHDPRVPVPALPSYHAGAAGGIVRRADPTVVRDYHNTININYRNPPKPPTHTPTAGFGVGVGRKPVRPAFTSPACAGYTQTLAPAQKVRPQTAPGAAHYARKPLPPVPSAHIDRHKPLPPTPLKPRGAAPGAGMGERRVAAAFAPLSAIGHAPKTSGYVPYTPGMSKGGVVGKAGRASVKTAPQHKSMKAQVGGVPRMGKPPTRGERFARRQMRGSVWT